MSWFDHYKIINLIFFDDEFRVKSGFFAGGYVQLDYSIIPLKQSAAVLIVVQTTHKKDKSSSSSAAAYHFALQQLTFLCAKKRIHMIVS